MRFPIDEASGKQRRMSERLNAIILTDQHSYSTIGFKSTSTEPETSSTFAAGPFLLFARVHHSYCSPRGPMVSIPLHLMGDGIPDLFAFACIPYHIRADRFLRYGWSEIISS